MKRMIPLIVVALSAAICAAQSEGAKTLVLEKNEGETRVRRPRGSVLMPTSGSNWAFVTFGVWKNW